MFRGISEVERRLKARLVCFRDRFGSGSCFGSVVRQFRRPLVNNGLEVNVRTVHSQGLSQADDEDRRGLTDPIHLLPCVDTDMIHV